MVALAAGILPLKYARIGENRRSADVIAGLAVESI